MTEPMRQVLIRMPADMHDALKQRAHTDDRTIAQTVRRAIRAYLDAAP